LDYGWFESEFEILSFVDIINQIRDDFANPGARQTDWSTVH
jgi:hypothetical protein